MNKIEKLENINDFYFSAINLGCNKNLVDLEFAIGNILNLSNEANIEFFLDPEDSKVEFVIVNTCSFLSSSRKEAEETILYYDNLGKKIIIIGCYTQLKDDEFLKSLKNLHSVIPYIKETDAKDILQNKINKIKEKNIGKYLENIGGEYKNKKAFIYDSKNTRAFLNADFSYEYLKISEGCDNNCSFCIIPSIRGRQKSRTIEDILEEVQKMISMGIKEIEIISQDTTRYGTDLYGEVKLIELLEKIDEIKGDFKYRLFYFYPDILTLKNLERMKRLKKLLPYFDIPFQHIEAKILKKMGRFYDENHIFTLLDYIKKEFNGAFIHTNFIVGFPGETSDNFGKLKDFAKRYEFDSVSMFGYHDEKLAGSYNLKDKIDDKTIENRVKELQKVLFKIYDKKEGKRKGKEEVGYIMDIENKNITIRPEIKAPEIDEYDKIKLKNIVSGNIEIGEKVVYIV